MDSLTILVLKKAEGGGGDITVESLSVSQNGEYTAPTGKAYSPITVAVPQTTVSSLSVTENGTYTATTGTAYSPVTVNVPGGLEYETGTYTPAEDINQPTISFANTHSTPPMFALISETSGVVGPARVLGFGIWVYEYAFGVSPKATSSITYYGRTQYQYTKNDAGSSSGTNSTSLPGSSPDTVEKFITASSFKPMAGTHNFATGVTYKWIAVWKPAT